MMDFPVEEGRRFAPLENRGFSKRVVAQKQYRAPLQTLWGYPHSRSYVYC